WMWTGFAMVILSAGLKGIPTEIIEAARVDGATEAQILRRIIIPMLGSTIAVVATTMIIFALKAFDIVYVMTNGNFGTDVLANRMYKEMFTFTNFGRATAIAVVLLLAIVPVMLINVRRFREQEQLR
ncbi:MAG: sugar ABC transporter permease, partial [Chloroflexi bacterium]|nr:sugar ABC transporter permease [Chloroflexota bacterium]